MVSLYRKLRSRVASSASLSTAGMCAGCDWRVPFVSTANWDREFSVHWSFLHNRHRDVACCSKTDVVALGHEHGDAPFWVAGLFVSDRVADLRRAVEGVTAGGTQHFYRAGRRVNDQREAGVATCFWQSEAGDCAVALVVLGTYGGARFPLERQMGAQFFSGDGVDPMLEESLHVVQVIPWWDFRHWWVYRQSYGPEPVFVNIVQLDQREWESYEQAHELCRCAGSRRRGECGTWPS